MAVSLFEQLRPDVTVIDLNMPEMGDLDAIKAIRCINRDARILALTTYQADMLARAVLAAGASGYMIKSAMRKELIEALQDIANGFKHISIDVALASGQYFDSDLLSVEKKSKIWKCHGKKPSAMYRRSRSRTPSTFPDS